MSLFLKLVFTLIYKRTCPGFGGGISGCLLRCSMIKLKFNVGLRTSLTSNGRKVRFAVVSMVNAVVVNVFVKRGLLGMSHSATCLVDSNATVYKKDTVTTINPMLGTGSDRVSITLTAVFMLGTVTLFVFPILNRVFKLSRRRFNA